MSQSAYPSSVDNITKVSQGDRVTSADWNRLRAAASTLQISLGLNPASSDHLGTSFATVHAKLTDHFEWETGTVTSTAALLGVIGSNPGGVAVSFAHTFSTIPIVIATLANESFVYLSGGGGTVSHKNHIVAAHAATVTTTGFALHGVRTHNPSPALAPQFSASDTHAAIVHWLAIGM